jgi:hypothetical protein
VDVRVPGALRRAASTSSWRLIVDYEIEVQELKDRRRSFGRLAVGALVTCVLALVLRHLM